MSAKEKSAHRGGDGEISLGRGVRGKGEVSSNAREEILETGECAELVTQSEIVLFPALEI